MIREIIIKEMKLRGDKMIDLSREINVSYPTIYNFLSDKKGIQLKILEKILKHYKLELVKRY